MRVPKLHLPVPRFLTSVYLFQFVGDGVFKAELNEFLTRELAEDGYSGVEVRVTPSRTEIIIMATRTQNVLGEKGRRIRELTSVVQKRFNFPENSVSGCFVPSITLFTACLWVWLSPEKFPNMCLILTG